MRWGLVSEGNLQSDQTAPQTGASARQSTVVPIRGIKSSVSFLSSKLNDAIIRAGGCILQMCDTFSSPASCFSGNREEVEASWLMCCLSHVTRNDTDTENERADCSGHWRFLEQWNLRKNMNGSSTPAHIDRQPNVIDDFFFFCNGNSNLKCFHFWLTLLPIFL